MRSVPLGSRHRRLILAMAVLASLPPASPAAAADDPPPVAAPGAAEDLRAAVAAAETAFAQAFANRDRARFFSFVDDDAVFFGGGGALRGKAAIEAGWGAFFDAPQAPFSWRPVVAEVNGDIGHTQGPVHDAAGKWFTNFSSVWRRQPDGSWKVLFDGAPPCGSALEAPPSAGS